MSLIKAILSGLLNKTVTPQQKQQRLAICNGCAQLYTPTRQCSLCLCFVDAKTEIKTEHCPVYKWGVVVSCTNTFFFGKYFIHLSKI